MKQLAFALLLACGFSNAEDNTEQKSTTEQRFSADRDPTALVRSPDGSACVRLGEMSLEVASLSTNSKSEPLTNSANEGQPISDVVILWSPDSSKVAVSIDCKRGNELHIYQNKGGQITEIALEDGADISDALPKNLGRTGRFYYQLPLSWTNDGKLKLSLEGNTTADKEEDWKWYAIPATAKLVEGKFVIGSYGKASIQPFGKPRIPAAAPAPAAPVEEKKSR